MLALKLKEITEDIHKEAERKMIAQLRQIRSASDYARLLNWMYGFYRPMEDLLAAQLTPDVFPDMEKRKRADNLLSDIRTTGTEIPEEQLCAELPVIDSFPKALGAMYVIEGSTLGGRVISAMLCRQLGEQYGYSFFNSYGLETAGMWMTFKSILERPYTREEENEMIQAAQDTFLIFKNWINQHELEPQL